MKNNYTLPCAEILFFRTEDILKSSSDDEPDLPVTDEGEF